jgi:hypothetical protein
MGRIEELYEAAGRAGLLVEAEVDGQTVAVDFRSSDETVLDALALSADYTIRFPRSVLPDLAAGDSIYIDGTSYRVREIRSVGDGSEQRATLTRL